MYILYNGGRRGKGEGDPASSGVTGLRCTKTGPLHLSLSVGGGGCFSETALFMVDGCVPVVLSTSRPSVEARLATKLEPLEPLPAARPKKMSQDARPPRIAINSPPQVAT